MTTQGYPQHGYQVPPPPQAQPRVGNNGFAVASLVLSLLWVFGLCSLLAVIFGHIALSQIKKTGELGQGFAIAGLVLGYIGLGIMVLAVAVGG
jgi:hypothetical protein